MTALYLDWCVRNRDRSRASSNPFEIAKGITELVSPIGRAIRSITNKLGLYCCAEADGHATGRVALQGYCLGALMAFITAARHEVDAAVAYHVGDTEKYLGEVGSLLAPLLMHLGEEDEFISKTAQAQIKAALAKKPNATVYSYPGQRHAFSRHNGLHYNATAAALANGRTSEFLNQHLR
jgi:dienelactone hydrolase